MNDLDDMPMQAPGGGWAVVSTHPNKEHIAQKQLGRQGFDCYCPRFARRIRHARHSRNVLRPLFSGYVFVRMDPKLQRYRSILSTIGVRTLVRFGDGVPLIDDSFIVSLKARQKDGIIIRSAALQQPIQPYLAGQKVKLNGSALDGTIATVLSVDTKGRLILLMDLLQHGVRAQVSAEQVMPAAKA